MHALFYTRFSARNVFSLVIRSFILRLETNLGSLGAVFSYCFIRARFFLIVSFVERELSDRTWRILKKQFSIVNLLQYISRRNLTTMHGLTKFDVQNYIFHRKCNQCRFLYVHGSPDYATRVSDRYNNHSSN